MAEMLICMFAGACKRTICSHKYPHFKTHMRSNCHYSQRHVCCNFAPNKVIGRVEQAGAIESMKIDRLMYARCIPYSYWKEAHDKGADIVMMELEKKHFDGSVTNGYRDGYRNNDDYDSGTHRDMYGFLQPKEERNNIIERGLHWYERAIRPDRGHEPRGMVQRHLYFAGDNDDVEAIEIEVEEDE